MERGHFRGMTYHRAALLGDIFPWGCPALGSQFWDVGSPLGEQGTGNFTLAVSICL